MSTTDDDYQVDLGGRLFAAGTALDQDGIDTLLLELTRRVSDRAVYARMAKAWIQATLEWLGVQPGDCLKLRDEAGEDLYDLAQMPPSAAWAALSVAAQTAGDEVEWATLMCALSADDAQARDQLGALLAMLGVTLHKARQAQQGGADTADVRAVPLSDTWSGRAATLRGNAALN